MSAIRSMPRHRYRAWTRVLRPRTITIRPLISGIAAALLLAVTLSLGHAIGTRRSSMVSGSGDATDRVGSLRARPKHAVQFVLVAPTARKVQVVGDFNDWDASHAEYSAQHRGGGVWSVTAAVPEGHHRYSFVVDDSLWVSDPTAPRLLDDDFGMPNSALVVDGGDLTR
ncbi:MAG TPA: isoamylase early set domain-containing protein [Gemmatimonadaceae bacterium]|nr:isoamylase early set domain-containing protein [Gemmatimonadaceae bacterium]